MPITMLEHFIKGLERVVHGPKYHLDNPLSELGRERAHRMLAQVLVAEADSFVAMWKDLKLPDGCDRVVRRVPHRAIQTEVGPFRSPSR